MTERTELGGVRLILLCLAPILALYLVFVATTPLREQAHALSNKIAIEIMTGDASGPSVFQDGTLKAFARVNGWLEKIWLTLTFALAAGLGACLSPHLSPRSVANGLTAVGIGLMLGLENMQRMSLYDASDWVLMAVCLSVALAGYGGRRWWHGVRRT